MNDDIPPWAQAQFDALPPGKPKLAGAPRVVLPPLDFDDDPVEPPAALTIDELTHPATGLIAPGGGGTDADNGSRVSGSAAIGPSSGTPGDVK